ncbi:hypothetical protein LDENG_00249560 [Lucifuga dentata]|nr:hypothetical protein LDENG_00249560 [Lucifuga dentata]
MDIYQDQILDSPSKNSYIGSYYQPPDRILPAPKDTEDPAFPSMVLQLTSPPVSHTTPNIDSKAVVDALKSLQEKIRRLELERKQAEKNFHQFSEASRKYEQRITSSTARGGPAASVPGTEDSNRKALDSKLRCAETRCTVLEKQLEYMREMVEHANKEKTTVMEHQASLQNQKQLSSSSTQTQQEKLEKLELECLKLSKSQTLAEMKLAALEHKLLDEEHKRKLVQEKADELQREMDLQTEPATDGVKPKKKTKKTSRRSSRQNKPASTSQLRRKKMPFLTGTSTSPSHSVHANVQSILHMLKHHQPQLCERVGVLQSSGCRAKKSLQKDFSPCRSEEADQSVGSLADLLLALQDELGQMSFEQQELVQQMDAAEQQEQKEDLQRELERLVARMEEKGAQISKLRTHQQSVRELSVTHTSSSRSYNCYMP